MPPRPDEETVPPLLRSATLLPWGYVAPQLVLVVLNLRGWWLIQGEAGPEQYGTALSLFGAEVLILALNIGLFVFLRHHKRGPDGKMALVLLVIHTAYPWFAVVAVSSLIPRNIPPWIIGHTDFLIWNVTFFMPAAFLSLFLVATTPLNLSGKRDALYTLATLIGIPVLWYLLITLLQPLFLHRIPEVIIIVVTLAVLMILLAALVRLVSTSLPQLRRQAGWRHYAQVVILGLAAPLGGLYLNRYIPFPADFQTSSVYALAVVNGLLLLARPGGAFPAVKLFARAASYPFIVYFFLVFLPFLPLSLFAIFAVGAGFLMLTPLVLGIFQTGILRDDFRAVQERAGRLRAPALMVAGLLILPGYFVLHTLYERQALYQALDAIYAPDWQAPPLSPTQAERAARAVVKLRNRKEGAQLPYLSGLYNYLVFGNLVLPDHKIERMHILLTGKPLPAMVHGDVLGRGDRRWRGGQVVAPQRDIELVTVDTKTMPTGSELHLVLRNRSDSTHAEYRAQLQVPEGVFVTGLDLKIDGAFVPGKIFDRKTALWVYQKITEVRRDPALLFYRSPTTLELRVYPFPAQGEREVKLRFLLPAGSPGGIHLDEREIVLNPDATPPPVYAAGDYVRVQGTLPAFSRSPYLHFILDFSVDPARYPARITAIATQLGITQLRLSAANLGYEDLGMQFKVTETGKIAAALKHAGLPRTGGFWPGQAVAKAMLAHAEAVAQGRFQKAPIFVVLSPRALPAAELQTMNLAALAFVTPDVDTWYLDAGGKLSQYDFAGRQAETVDAPVMAPVHALQRGTATALFNPARPTVAALPGNQTLAVFNPHLKRFLPPAANQVAHPGTAWEARAALWWQWRSAAIHPARLENRRAELLAQSRALEMLIPTTALMVVENSAQWRILERKERQSLANKSALEFEEVRETPEPPEWLLILLVLGLVVLGRRRALVINPSARAPAAPEKL